MEKEQVGFRRKRTLRTRSFWTPSACVSSIVFYALSGIQQVKDLQLKKPVSLVPADTVLGIQLSKYFALTLTLQKYQF